jgi:uncharacterized protein YjbI with pentapeptide repeats
VCFIGHLDPSSRSDRRGVAVIVLMAAVAVFALVAASPARAATPVSLAAADFVAEVVAGRPVELDGVTIVGDLDLQPVDTAHRVIRCTNCTFEGSVRASNVIFERVVDLSGSSIAGRLDFDGAIFRDTFLMRRTALRSASVGGPTSFSLAAFRGRASFEGVQLTGDADFRVAQFLGDASFGDADFGAEARFDSAIFSGQAQFSSSPAGGDVTAPDVLPSPCSTATRGAFGGPLSMAAVTFAQKADFRQRCFGGPATFTGATFGAADFTLAVFLGTADFDDSSIEGVASFRVTTFEDSLSFQHVVLGGPTDFEAAILLGPTELFGTSAADSLSLDKITTAAPLELDKVRANGFEMDLALLDQVEGEPVREDVLTMVEASARARGDLGLANEAAFQRAEMQTARAAGWDHAKGLAGELIAGYLVKPFYPLRAFIVLLIVGALVRTIGRLAPWITERFTILRSRRGLVPAFVGAGVFEANVTAGSTGSTGSTNAPGSPASGRSVAAPARTSLLNASKLVVIIASSASATLRAAFRLKPHDVPAELGEQLSAYGFAFLAGLEWLAFKILLALFLIGLANSNPTFKQLVEAVIR